MEILKKEGRIFFSASGSRRVYQTFYATIHVSFAHKIYLINVSKSSLGLEKTASITGRQWRSWPGDGMHTTFDSASGIFPADI